MKFPETVRLAGDGLVLREWTRTDVPAMVELFDEESVDVWTPLESPFDTEAAERYLDRSERGRAAGVCVQLAITTDGAVPLGEIILFDGGERTVEFAYAVGRAHRGQRLAARSLRLVMDFAAGLDDPETFTLKISPANPASECAARAAGFTRTGAPLEVRERKGRRVELAVWRAPVLRR